MTRFVVRGMLVFTCLWMLSAVPSTAQRQPSDAAPVPDFDIRTSRGGRAPSGAATETAALERIQSRAIGTIRTRQHPFAPGIRMLFAEGGALTERSAASAESIAWAFLSEHHEAFGLTQADLAHFVKTREYRSASESVTHITYSQSVRGLRVFGADVRVHVNDAGEIVLVSSSAVPVSARPAIRAPSVGPDSAVRAAVGNVRPGLVFQPRMSRASAGADAATVFERGPFARDIRAAQILFADADGVRAAWRVLVEPDPTAESYELIVDGESGDVVFRRNNVYFANGAGAVLQSNATFAADARRPDVAPLGSAAGGPGDPQHGCPPVANRTSRSLNSQYRDPAGVLFNTGRLEGNNSHVYRTAAGTEGALGTLDGQGVWQFDFPFNTASAAETHLFFALNFVHDFFYDLGFDEAAGNFQVDNYGRGGEAGDSVIGLARASGRNNATMSTPPDGSSPTMSMFLWDGSGCWASDVNSDSTLDNDGTIDSDIVVHEFHHGVHTRLNTNWIGAEAGAMGEGGGDFFAYSIYGDTKLADYAAPPNGIREINAKRYGDWFCFLGICSVHELGKIWANVLWDLREQFRADGVGGSNEEAIRRVHLLYIDALKLSPSAPTMLEMRDAMLVADTIRYPSADPGGSENACRLWRQFAMRGMGFGARDTKDTGNLTVTESFTVTPVCPSLPTGPTVSISATTPTAMEAGAVAGAFTVTRNGDTSANLTVVFTAAGSAAAGLDYGALSGGVTIPAGSTSATITVAPIDDTTVENDETVVVTLKASPLYTVATATATVTIKSNDVGPDLYVSSVTAPAAAGAGTTISVNATIMNKGAGPASGSVARLHLSSNAAFEVSDPVVGEWNVPALAPSATNLKTVAVALAANLTGGTYYLFTVADATNVVVETIEFNNRATSTVKIGPDLVVSTLTAPAAAVAGTPISVTETTKNQGAGSAATSDTRFYWSANSTYDAADTLIGGRVVPSLTPNGVSSGVTTVTIPANATAGTYYLFGVSDADKEVGETLETNNTKYATVKIGPDLMISTLTAPAFGGAGGSIVIKDTTKNQGTGLAGASTTTFYLSTNSTIDGTDTVLGSRPVPVLAAAGMNLGTTTVTLPANAATGTYYLIASADSGGAVVETLETNNTKFVLFRIGPDLNGLLNVPAIAARGATISITDTTRNIGGGAAGASVTRFYLSPNTTLDAGDTQLGQRDVPSLAAGGTNAVTTSITLPTLPAGRYYLFMKADAADAIVETMETNNTTYKIIDLN